MLNYLSLVLTALIFGSTFIVIKDSVSVLDPFALLTLRFGVASIALYALVCIKKLKPSDHLGLGLITGVIQFLTYAPQTIGLQYTTPSNSAFITGLFVVFTPIISSIFFKKTLRTQDFIATIIALIGVWILTGGINALNIGDLITFVTAIAIATHILLTSRALEKGANAIVITYQQIVVTAVLSLVFAFILGESFISRGHNVYISILYLGIFASFIAYLFQNASLNKVNPILASIILSFEPFFALLFSWGFGFERFSIMKLLGGMLILVAFIVSEIEKGFVRKIFRSS